ncbi:PspA-associated protein PspAB [Carbonactinospora thermoautotrophica]|uniref:PspA-associated protein PspAB n=1 Tax=Carbonactinospora thermoautotrophica TaxID=1469144 RepID=UPI003DA9C895
MRFLDALLNLDVLFAIPSAAYTLQAGLGLAPTGVGAVCFKTTEGQAATQAQADALALADAGSGGRTTVSHDEYSYTWVTCRRADADLPALVTALHAINVTLAEAGFGSSLLCTVIGFAAGGDNPRRLGLVYLFKRGTFYPFAPAGGQTRDTALEIQVRAQLGGELPIEPDLSRWFPIWAAPAL